MDGQRVTCDPTRIEEILREAWNAIFQKGAHMLTQQADTFMAERGHLFPQRGQDGLGRLSGSRVRRCAEAGPATSAGSDGWMPAELRWLPPLAFD
eukprot:7455905-Alexandrium_andersonii.AAC.1